ncbi:MAG: hypothetical protein GXN93_03020 [Candidatus Diapherotrites archaeon]|nr:hypothetical protein [Candidatus Diapherotrites archaeon]
MNAKNMLITAILIMGVVALASPAMAASSASQPAGQTQTSCELNTQDAIPAPQTYAAWFADTPKDVGAYIKPCQTYVITIHPCEHVPNKEMNVPTDLEVDAYARTSCSKYVYGECLSETRIPEPAKIVAGPNGDVNVYFMIRNVDIKALPSKIVQRGVLPVFVYAVGACKTPTAQEFDRTPWNVGYRYDYRVSKQFENKPIKDILEVELHCQYPPRENGKWMFDVTKKVQMVYPDVTKAVLEGNYDIESYWQVSADTFRTPEEIVKGWENGYEIAKLNVDGNWYFVKIPAKLTMERSNANGKIAAKIIPLGDCYANVPINRRPLGAQCMKYMVVVNPPSVRYKFIVKDSQGYILEEKSGIGEQNFEVYRPITPEMLDNPLCIEVVTDNNEVIAGGDCSEMPKTTPTAKIKAESCPQNEKEQHIVGERCTRYTIDVTPDATSYIFLVKDIQGQVIRRYMGHGDQNFDVLLPLIPETAGPMCVEVLWQGKVIGSSGCENEEMTNPQTHSKTKEWNVIVNSPFPYQYEVEKNNLHLMVFVNYMARNGCEGISAKVVPLRCPNCYEVDLIPRHAEPGEVCTQVIRRIPYVNVEIPLSRETNTVHIDVKMVGTNPVPKPTPVPKPFMCMDLEANVIEIKNMLQSCKIKCTDADKEKIIKAIDQLRARAKELNCKVVIPKPVFPAPIQPQPIPKEKILPEEKGGQAKNSSSVTTTNRNNQMAHSQYVPSAPVGWNITNIVNNVRSIIARIFQIW